MVPVILLFTYCIESTFPIFCLRGVLIDTLCCEIGYSIKAYDLFGLRGREEE